MTPQSVALMGLVWVVASVALSACGTAGGTSRFVVPLELGQQPTPTAEVRVGSTGMDVDPAYLHAVNVFRWGKFDAADLRNLDVSLRDTIARHRPSPAPGLDTQLELHLVIRRYVVSASNIAGAVLACVAWAATTPQGTLLFAEQFYASHVVYVVGTLGLLKDEVHRAIVGRIATTAMTLAADPAATRLRPITYDNTSTSLDEAAARLPRTMVSMGVPLGPGPIGLIGILIPSGIMTVQWEVANPSDKFDWAGYLQKVYTRP
jgi:hypothetical protein